MTVWNLLLWGLLLILLLLLLDKLILHRYRRHTAFVSHPPVLASRSSGSYSLLSIRFGQGRSLVSLLSKLPLPKKSTKPSRNQLKKAKRRSRKAQNRAHVNPKTDKVGYFGLHGNNRFAALPDIDEDEPICHPNSKTDKVGYLGLQRLGNRRFATLPNIDEDEPICHPSENTDTTKGIIQRYLELLGICRFATRPIFIGTDGPICYPHPKDTSNTSPRVIQRAGLFRPELHGMDNYEKDLMEFLEHGTTPLMGILGMHGMGKTTLLKLMRTYYNQFSHFSYMFFVEAGEGFTTDVLSGVINRDMGFDTIPVVNHISSFLRNQSFLLLLDDLQCALNLADAGLPMKLGPQQKIVFTTRDESVLVEMGCAGNNLRMNGLDEVAAWNLFTYLVGDKIINSHPDIKDLAKEMVAECHGIPGALCTLGGLMSTKKNLEPWIVAHEMLVKSQPSHEIEEMENEGYPCLQFLLDEI